jgi:DnaJ-domain-containing protein 1
MEDSFLRPFKTFGLNPFLWIEAKDFSVIQKKYLQLSREFHPDRVSQDSDDAQQKAEEISSQINFDYSQLKDFWKLLEVVLSEGLKSANCPVRHPHQAPPEFAIEYFELQEEISDLGLNSEQANAKLRSFRERVFKKLDELESQIKAYASRFPYQGFGKNSTPWEVSDLLLLQDLLESHRYLKSFLKDIESKIVS